MAATARPVVPDSLELQLAEAKGQKRIPLLLELAKANRSREATEAIRYGSEALALLKEHPNPDQQIEAWFQIGWAHIYRREFDAAHSYAVRIDSAVQFTDQQDDLAKAYLLKGRIARQQGEYEKSISVLDSALVLTGKSSDKELRVQILNEAGSVHRRMGANSKALAYHTEALELAREANDKVSISTTLGYMGIIHDILGNYDEALRYQQQTLKLRRELDDRRGVAAALTNIGIMHQKIRNFDEAMRFYGQALAIWEELDREPEMAATYNNMGGVQEMLDNYEEALKYYQQALAIWQKMEDSFRISIALRNIGALKTLQGHYEEALGLHLKALEIRESLGDRTGSSGSLVDVAELYQKLGQHNLAQESAHRGLELAKETQSWPLIRDAHQVLSAIYDSTGQFAEALAHYKSYKTAEDSVFNIESQSVIADLQEKYRSKEQQQQIAMLQQQDQIQSMWLGISIGGLICVGIMLVLTYSWYLLKQRAYRARQRLQEIEIERAALRSERAEAQAHYLEAENDRKSRELKAARELQLSMLPLEIPEHPTPASIISASMKTASEVGGDYYDFDLAEDGTLTIAIGDATGHGLKAGTLVTAVKSLFSLLARDTELPEILRRSSKAIKRMNMPQLYMALALVRLRHNRLELAGAGMPPALIYRAATGHVEKIALKGMPLGSVIDFPYQQTCVTLEQNDVVLLYSDGFAELFNSEGEMLGYEIMPELLVRVGNKTPGEIIQYFNEKASEWLSDGNQQDDITFLALKSIVKEKAVSNIE